MGSIEAQGEPVLRSYKIRQTLRFQEKNIHFSITLMASVWLVI